MVELFPPTDRHHSPPERKPFSADQAANVIASDAMVIAMAAAKLRKQEELTEQDMSEIIDIHTRATAIRRGI